MMEFCSSCGFLLASELVGKSNFCRPCSVGQESKHNGEACHCEICGFPESSARGSKPISRNCDVRKVNDKSKSCLETKKANKAKQFQKKDQPHSEPTSYDRESEWGISRLYESPEEVEKKSIEDWFEHPTNHDWTDWSDEPWTEVKRTSDPNTHATFGDYDFPVLQEGLTERKVEETIQADWERQQNEYKSKLVMEDTKDVHRVVNSLPFEEKRGRFLIAGVDISFIKNDETNACACLTVVALPDLKVMYQAIEMVKLTQPYIPGFLAFREIPPLMVLFENLKRDCPHYLPDMIMVDGNGILHPRGFGMASQLGVLLDIPTIGVAKSLISAQGITDDDVHKAKKQTLKEAGDGFDLISQETGQVLGKCVMSHDKASNPIYVSVGHKITLKSAIWLTLECCKYREPEPVRRADLDSREYIRMRKNKPQRFAM